ncbi:Protein sds23 [Dipsacomyces acuminosporus]|nr:Protein sds23 [Dipsacomyces acuminosporus]
MARPTTPVIQALSLLERWHISSIAIVDDGQRLVGNLSVTDVKYLIKEKHLLHGTCIDLVQAVRFYQGMKDGRDRAAVFSVRPEATLRYALTKLIATGAHRVWVTAPPSTATSTSAADAVSNASSSRDRSGSTASLSNRRASVSSASSQTVPIAPPNFAGAFTDVVCGVVSLTDILRVLVDNSPKPAADPEYNYASMD